MPRLGVAIRIERTGRVGMADAVNVILRQYSARDVTNAERREHRGIGQLAMRHPQEMASFMLNDARKVHSDVKWGIGSGKVLTF